MATRRAYLFHGNEDDESASGEIDDKYYKHTRLIDKTSGKLKDFMIPDLIIDADNESKLFGFTDKRDIQQQNTTTKKNALILEKVRGGGENGYKYFKELLNKTKQGKLVEFLDLTENGIETKEIEEELYKMAEMSLNTSPNYFKLKRDLQSDLIKLYRDSCDVIHICPCLEEVDASLTEVYKPPYPLYFEETDKLKVLAKHDKEIKERTVHSLEEMFHKQSKECRNIYLTAEPGLGKTSFAKWLALNWCHAHDPVDEEGQYFDQREVSQLEKFDFVFLIFLRGINQIHVDSMIENLIKDNIGKQNRYTAEFVEKVLCGEKCLIVLDGLDEWSGGVPDIPKVKSVHRGCTYITTSRPWKFCAIPLNLYQIDQHLSIKNIQEFCKEKLVPSILAMFKKRQCLRDDISDIAKASNEFREMLVYKNVTHFYETPFTLVQLLVLWNMDKTIGNSECKIYCDMVEAIFSRSESKVDLKLFENKSSSEIVYFQGRLCEKYYNLMIKVGRLAFGTLFVENEKSSLVFDKTIALRYVSDNENNNSPDETLSACLKTGLLSKQHEYIRARKTYTYSFQHKTVQEYFAAIYVQSHYKNELKQMIVNRCITVSKILEMGTVFMFLSGLSPDIAREVFQSLQRAVNEDENTEIYRSNPSSRFNMLNNPMKKIQNMVAMCVEESRNNEHEDVNLPLEDVMIDGSCKQDKYKSALTSLITYNCKNLKSLSYDDRPLYGLLSRIFDDTPAMNPPLIDIETYFVKQNMLNLCKLHISIGSIDKGTSSSRNIASQIATLSHEHLKSLYLSSVQQVGDIFMETILHFVSQQTILSNLYLDLKSHENLKLRECTFNQSKNLKTLELKNVQISHLKLNERLQDLTLTNVPVSKLELNEHLRMMTLTDVPLSQLKLNERLHNMILTKVPVSQLELNERLQQLTLINVPLSQLELNEHLHKMTLTDVPLSRLELNEHLHKMILTNVPVSQLELNERLQQLTLINVPLSQLELNEHLHKMTLTDVPLKRLELNEHLHKMTLTDVPLKRLELNEHLHKMILTNVPVSQLQVKGDLQEMILSNVSVTQIELNERLQEMTLQNAPVSQLQLTEHLTFMMLINVRVSQLKLNEHLQEMILVNVPLSQIELNENLRYLHVENVPVLKLTLNEHLHECILFDVNLSKLRLNKQLQKLKMNNVSLTDIKKFLSDVFGRLSIVPFTTVTNCLLLDSEQAKWSTSCILYLLGSKMSQTITITCGFKSFEMSDGELLLHLIRGTLTSTTLYELVGIQCDADLKVQLEGVTIVDNISENEVETKLKDFVSTGKSPSNGKTIIYFHHYVSISNEAFLQFVKFVEKCNSHIEIAITTHEDYTYKKGIEFARSSTSLKTAEQMSKIRGTPIIDRVKLSDDINRQYSMEMKVSDSLKMVRGMGLLFFNRIYEEFKSLTILKMNKSS